MHVIALGLCLAVICVILQLQFNLHFRHMPKVNVALIPFYSLMIGESYFTGLSTNSLFHL